MGKYMIKRILIAIPVLIGITIIDYAIMCLAGSPLQMLQGPRISQAAVAAKEIALGLDKPFYVQYFVWLKQLLHGNMGYSIKSYQAVSEMIASHLGPTLLLMGVSLLVSLLMAVPAGIYSAIKQYSAGDYTVVTLSFLGSSVPGFFLSLLLIYLFTVKLGWLPSSGMATLGTAGGAGDVAKHMVMPVLVLATSMAGTNIRYIRSAMLEILQQDYLRTAKAKGIGRFLVINKHALRNALIPIITVIGMEIPVLFGGQVIIEHKWYVDGIINPDANVVTDAGKGAIFSTGQGWPAAAESWAFGQGIEKYDVTKVFGPLYTTETIQGSMNAVSANSNYKAEALKVLQLMNTDAKFRNMCAFGTEGNFMKYEEDGTVTKLRDDWVWPTYTQGTFFILATQSDGDPDAWKQVQEQNEAATSSTCLGFVFDPEPVQNEIANVNTAWEKYNNDLLTGAIDPETTVPTIIDELNAAGLQTVIDEAQKQLDAFFAE